MSLAHEELSFYNILVKGAEEGRLKWTESPAVRHGSVCGEGGGEHVKSACLFEGCMCPVYTHVCPTYVLYVHTYTNTRHDNPS